MENKKKHGRQVQASRGHERRKGKKGKLGKVRHGSHGRQHSKASKSSNAIKQKRNQKPMLCHTATHKSCHMLESMPN